MTRLLPGWLRCVPARVAAPRSRGRGRHLERRDAAGGRLRADRRAAAGGGADGGAGGDARVTRCSAPRGTLVVSATTATSARLGRHRRAARGRRRGALRRALGRRSRSWPRAVLVARRTAPLRRDLRSRLEARHDRLPVRARDWSIAVAPGCRACSASTPATATSSRCAQRRCWASSATSTPRRSRSARGSLALLIALRRLAPKVPATLVVLVLAIVLSALLDLEDARRRRRRPAFPWRCPDPAIPDISCRDFLQLIAAGARCARRSPPRRSASRVRSRAKHDYRTDPNRDLVAMGVTNALAGLLVRASSSRAARARPTAADSAGGDAASLRASRGGADPAHRRVPAPLFADLPQATLAAIVIVAVAGFFDVAELRRFARVRRSAAAFAVRGARSACSPSGCCKGLWSPPGLSLDPRRPAPQPPVRRRARPRSADRRLGPHRPPPRLDGTRGHALLRSDGPLLLRRT